MPSELSNLVADRKVTPRIEQCRIVSHPCTLPDPRPDGERIAADMHYSIGVDQVASAAPRC
jgi:hypothetical protein